MFSKELPWKKIFLGHLPVLIEFSLLHEPVFLIFKLLGYLLISDINYGLDAIPGSIRCFPRKSIACCPAYVLIELLASYVVMYFFRNVLTTLLMRIKYNSLYFKWVVLPVFDCFH